MWRRSRKQRERVVKVRGWSAAAMPGYLRTFVEDVKALQGRLLGDVVLPADDAYSLARQLSNPAFQHFPRLIVYCEVFRDVYECLVFARKHTRPTLAVTTRSGGHSTAGFSANDGMVIDLSRLNGVYVDPTDRRAVVGPGTNWERLNATLADYRLHVPTGICGDVCVAGFMQGGGYGLTSRKFGMNCDNVVEMLVMLANGCIVRANEHVNDDLFWAMRGGTGNNFGVLLQATYRLHELEPLWGFGLRWTLEQAPDALVALQADYMSSGVTADLGYMAALVYDAEDGDAPEPVLIMRGVYWGDRGEGLRSLQPLIEGTGASLQLDTDRDLPGDPERSSYNKLNSWLFETPRPVPDIPQMAREDKQSTIIARKLTLDEWRTVCALFVRCPNPWGCFAIEPYGGAINAIGRDQTAFVHRDADMDFFVDTFWTKDEDSAKAQAWLDDCMTALDKYSNGESYQNYPRQQQTDYRARYWAEVFPRLLRIKVKYDPDNVFRYAQSVSPLQGLWPDAAHGAIGVEPWSTPPI
jgi:FAD/FMN-containing dehydrogenase